MSCPLLTVSNHINELLKKNTKNLPRIIFNVFVSYCPSITWAYLKVCYYMSSHFNL